MIKGIIGAVIGDIAGSTHEGKPVKSMRFDTLSKQSTVTDDSVLTMAVAEWMLDREREVRRARADRENDYEASHARIVGTGTFTKSDWKRPVTR